MFKIDLLALTALTSLRWHCFAFKSWISHQNLSRFGFPTRICQYLDFLLEFVKIWISYQNLSRLATHLMTQATFELLVQCRNDLLTKVFSGNMLGKYLQDMMMTMMMLMRRRMKMIIVARRVMVMMMVMMKEALTEIARCWGKSDADKALHWILHRTYSYCHLASGMLRFKGIEIKTFLEEIKDPTIDILL